MGHNISCLGVVANYTTIPLQGKATVDATMTEFEAC